jgi:hypothetical protein
MNEKLVKRLDALEALRPLAIAPDPRRDALTRVRAALRTALPNDPIYGPQRMGFEDKLIALHARMVAGALTAEDCAVLDALPREDLAVLGLTAREVVAMYWRLHTDF